MLGAALSVTRQVGKGWPRIVRLSGCWTYVRKCAGHVRECAGHATPWPGPGPNVPAVAYGAARSGTFGLVRRCGVCRGLWSVVVMRRFRRRGLLIRRSQVRILPGALREALLRRTFRISRHSSRGSESAGGQRIGQRAGGRSRRRGSTSRTGSTICGTRSGPRCAAAGVADAHASGVDEAPRHCDDAARRGLRAERAGGGADRGGVRWSGDGARQQRADVSERRKHGMTGQPARVLGRARCRVDRRQAVLPSEVVPRRRVV
jgi:hypothetical protein